MAFLSCGNGTSGGTAWLTGNGEYFGYTSSLVIGTLTVGQQIYMPQNGRIIINVHSFNTLTSDDYNSNIVRGTILLLQDKTVALANVGTNNISNADFALILNASVYAGNISLN